MFVKVCGLKRFEEIDWAVELGYDAIGIVVYKKSKRFVDYNKAIELFNYAKGKIKTVAVSLYCEDVLKFKDFADFIQCYEKCLSKNFIFATDAEPKFKEYKYLLFDSSKGKGEFKKFPEWIKKYREILIVAGGLNSKNVGKVINEIKPFGVDVSSGVEENSKKDFYLMKEFITIVKERL